MCLDDFTGTAAQRASERQDSPDDMPAGWLGAILQRPPFLGKIDACLNTNRFLKRPSWVECLPRNTLSPADHAH